jgi:hypothetical protein
MRNSFVHNLDQWGDIFSERFDSFGRWVKENGDEIRKDQEWIMENSNSHKVTMSHLLMN